MSRTAKGFDLLAPFYDDVARLVIGKDIVNAQLHFLRRLTECNRLLIIGGGTGWFLDFLCSECPDIEIDYIDLSPVMIDMASKRTGNGKRINFIEGTVNDIPDQLYDGVISNFYLDMFDESSLSVVIEKIKKSLSSSAFWIVTDFVNGRMGHKLKLWLMYRFFRIVARIEASRLPDWQNQMILSGSKLIDCKISDDGFIVSNLYLTRASQKKDEFKNL
jgi:ubiquinone/menaquinone biosynthesis C-methylase UbiE